jgi:hypothetical protein
MAETAEKAGALMPSIMIIGKFPDHSSRLIVSDSVKDLGLSPYFPQGLERAGTALQQSNMIGLIAVLGNNRGVGSEIPSFMLPDFLTSSSELPTPRAIVALHPYGADFVRAESMDTVIPPQPVEGFEPALAGWLERIQAAQAQAEAEANVSV